MKNKHNEHADVNKCDTLYKGGLWAICLAILLLSSTPSYTQVDSSYVVLRDQLERTASGFLNLSPMSNELCSVAELAPTKEEIAEWIDYDIDLTVDSIEDHGAKEFLLGRMLVQIKQLMEHPAFLSVGPEDAFGSSLAPVVSPDNKLWNIAIEEGHGGTYRSFISIMHYRFAADSAHTWYDEYFEDGNDSPFEPDGYHSIDTLQTQGGLKYILEGYVRGCSYCFEESFSLFDPNGPGPGMDFQVAVNSRSWDEKMIWDQASRTLRVRYITDDLTEDCYCEGEQEDEHSSESDEDSEFKELECTCTYHFNGISFELIHQSSNEYIPTDR